MIEKIKKTDIWNRLLSNPKYSTNGNSKLNPISITYIKNNYKMFDYDNWINQNKYTITINEITEQINSNNIIIVGTPTWSQDVDSVIGNKVNDNKEEEPVIIQKIDILDDEPIARRIVEKPEFVDDQSSYLKLQALYESVI